MLTPRARIVPAAAVVVAGAFLSAFSLNPAAVGDPLTPPKAAAVANIAIAADTGVLEDDRRRTLAELIDRSLERDGMLGALVGTVTSQGQSQRLRADDPMSTVTDYAFTVEEALAGGERHYPAGSEITVRTPGGTAAGTTLAIEGSPTFEQGQRVLVYVQEQAADAPAGGRTADILPIISENNVAVVQGEDALFPLGRIDAREAKDRLRARPARR